MAVEKAIRDYLLTKTAVTDLVTGARLQPEVISQGWTPNQGPFVYFEIVSSDEEHTLADRTGFVSTRFKFVCVAGSRLTANATARAIKNCGLAAMKGTYSSVSIRGVEVESGIRTDVEKVDSGQNDYRYYTEFDVMVHYLEG